MSPDRMTVAEDRARSPYTGWGRAHWEQVADRLLVAPRRFASPRHASIRFPGPVSSSGAWSDGLEGFARTFVLAGFRLRGAAGADPLGLAQWYADGLAAGVDPASPERWPTLLERRQARVEAASIVVALHESRPWIWDRLPERTREQVVDWLRRIVGTADYANNWIWFQNLVEAFLRSVGGPWSADDIERNLALHESWYAGDGWYTDGGVRNFDYYGWWAMHFYPLWYCRLLPDGVDPGYRDRHRARLRRFLADAQHLVAADGAPVLQGRSATYRFGMLAPYWAGALFDATPLEPGLTRRIASGVLRYFLDRGAVDADGLLPIGWHGDFPAVRQSYSGAASPYWASKGFAGLLLPADHPVWTAVERPMPVEEADSVRVLRAPGWIVSGTRADGIVRLANHGTDHAGAAGVADSPWYARHGYASHAAPELPGPGTLAPPDNHVALVDVHGRPSHRTPLRPVDIGEAGLASTSRAHWPPPGPAQPDRPGEPGRAGPSLTTASIVRGALEIRLARVDPADAPPNDADIAGRWPDDPGPWRLFLSGWAVAGDDKLITETTDTTALVRHDELVSAAVAVRGLTDADVTMSRRTNPLGARSAYPWVATTGPVRHREIYAAAILLSQDPRAIADAHRVRVDADGDAVTVTWPDGSSTPLRLAAPDPS